MNKERSRRRLRFFMPIVPLKPGTQIITIDGTGIITVLQVTDGTISGVTTSQVYQGDDKFAAAAVVFEEL